MKVDELTNVTEISWNRVDMEKENKNLPEPGRMILFRGFFTDPETNQKYEGIEIAKTTAIRPECENYKDLPKGTIFYYGNGGFTEPIVHGFQWVYANKIEL